MFTRYRWLPAVTWAIVMFSIALPAVYAQDTVQCSVGNIFNNSGPITISIAGPCNIVQPPELGPAEVRFVQPKLIDLRTIRSPGDEELDMWLDAEAVVSVESMAYEHVAEPAVKARVQVEQLVLRIGSFSVSFRSFQWVNIGEDGKGWLGRVGDAGPFYIKPGETRFHTTMFKPVDPLSWRRLLELIKGEDMLRVDILAVVSGAPTAPEEKAIITTFCEPSLARTHRRIEDHLKHTGREPARVHIYCDGS